MNSNTQNTKIEAITATTLVIGIDVGSETHYARAFDHRGFGYSKKAFKFSNDEAGFETFKAPAWDEHECLTSRDLHSEKREDGEDNGTDG